MYQFYQGEINNRFNLENEFIKLILNNIFKILMSRNDATVPAVQWLIYNTQFFLFRHQAKFPNRSISNFTQNGCSTFQDITRIFGLVRQGLLCHTHTETVTML